MDVFLSVVTGMCWVDVEPHGLTILHTRRLSTFTGDRIVKMA
jgi:hypothetical protein